MEAIADIPALKPEALEALERRLLGVQERRQIKKSMVAWARYRGFDPAAHHRLICEEVQAFLFDPELDVLLLHAPPGSAKSTYISALLPDRFGPRIFTVAEKIVTQAKVGAES